MGKIVRLFSIHANAISAPGVHLKSGLQFRNGFIDLDEDVVKELKKHKDYGHEFALAEDAHWLKKPLTAEEKLAKLQKEHDDLQKKHAELVKAQAK